MQPNPNKVVVYTKKPCGYCSAAIRYLESVKSIQDIEVIDLTGQYETLRELMMARISAVDSQSVGDVLDQFGGTIVDSSATELIVSVDAHPDELDKFELALNVFDIRELQRTGRIALGRLGS